MLKRLPFLIPPIYIQNIHVLFICLRCYNGSRCRGHRFARPFTRKKEAAPSPAIVVEGAAQTFYYMREVIKITAPTIQQ
jgi:hypothetical protein